MLFNSWQFLLFFPIVTALYFMLPHKFRWGLLLTASCLFYMSFVPMYLLVLAATIMIDYVAALWIERETGRRRMVGLVVSVVSTCLVLFIFKYFNFFNENFTVVARFLHWNYSVSALKLVLPIGLSFHTFQSLSYVIEVYRGEQKAERHFGIYSLYVMFYPQLVAGPIERPQNLLHQFYEEHQFDSQNVADGLRLMAWGLFKKVVIADRAAVFVDAVYGNPGGYQAGSLILATVLFAVQVFCDFSGYSDIAMGSARVMGFSLMQNFDRPYWATSLSGFWKRWHISLSTWLRDYIYTPLSISVRSWGLWAIVFSLMVTFFISGLWHGASWTYVAWGLLHGVGLSVEVFFGRWKKKLASRLPPGLFTGLGWVVTFSFVCFAYVFFRARTIGDAFFILERIWGAKSDWLGLLVLSPLSTLREVWTAGVQSAMIFGQPFFQFQRVLCAVACMELVHFFQRDKSIPAFLSSLPDLFRWTCYYGLLFGMILYGVWFQKRDFIYFQF